MLGQQNRPRDFVTKSRRILELAFRERLFQFGTAKLVLEHFPAVEPMLGVIAAHDDAMALGSRKAFQEASDSIARDRWLAVPYLGIDGMPKTGQAWVLRGLLTATVIVPTNTGMAIEMLAHALQTGTMPPEKTVTVPRSFPAIEELAKKSQPKEPRRRWSLAELRANRIFRGRSGFSAAACYICQHAHSSDSADTHSGSRKQAKDH